MILLWLRTALCTDISTRVFESAKTRLGSLFGASTIGLRKELGVPED